MKIQKIFQSIVWLCVWVAIILGIRRNVFNIPFGHIDMICMRVTFFVMVIDVGYILITIIKNFLKKRK